MHLLTCFWESLQKGSHLTYKSLALTSVLQLLSPQCWFPPVHTCCLQTLGRGTFAGTDIMESSDHREGDVSGHQNEAGSQQKLGKGSPSHLSHTLPGPWSRYACAQWTQILSKGPQWTKPALVNVSSMSSFIVPSPIKISSPLSQV